jgi:hypothetical protein
MYFGGADRSLRVARQVTLLEARRRTIFRFHSSRRHQRVTTDVPIGHGLPAVLSRSKKPRPPSDERPTPKTNFCKTNPMRDMQVGGTLSTPSQFLPARCQPDWAATEIGAFCETNPMRDVQVGGVLSTPSKLRPARCRCTAVVNQSGAFYETNPMRPSTMRIALSITRNPPGRPVRGSASVLFRNPPT